jgi:hypothetical protein
MEPSTNFVTIAHMRIRRQVDEKILAHLSPYLRSTADELLDLQFPSHEFVPLRVADPLTPLADTYNYPYLRTMGDLTRLLSTDDEIKAAIIASGGADRRAGSIWSTITGTGARFGERLSVLAPAGSSSLSSPRRPNVPEQEERVQIDPPSLHVRIGSQEMDRHTGPWSFLVRDEQDRIVHQINGSGPPSSVVWDWRLASGELIEAANYTLAFEWIDGKGKRWSTRRHDLCVAARRQEIEIDVTSLPRPAEGAVDRVLLFIDGEPRGEEKTTP